MEQTDLRALVRLDFANHMNRFATGNCAPQALRRRRGSAFDGPMVRFHDVIKILHGRCWQFSSGRNALADKRNRNL